MRSSHRARRSLLAAGLFLGVVAGCSTAKDDERSHTAPTAPPTSNVVVHGSARLDGRPFDSRFIGAVVLNDGLVTACQRSLPPVQHGGYAIQVLAASNSSGCGSRGSRVALWTFANDRIMFSTNTFAWPHEPHSVTFSPRYSTSAPRGIVPETADFSGTAFDARRNALPAGTKVDAYIGNTRCGTASVRSNADFTGYILDVVGPDSIAGCTRDANVMLRINDRPAVQPVITNTPPGRRDALDISLR
jgi:hypothetical protein